MSKNYYMYHDFDDVWGSLQCRIYFRNRMVKVITQETFDEVVNENVVEFGDGWGSQGIGTMNNILRKKGKKKGNWGSHYESHGSLYLVTQRRRAWPANPEACSRCRNQVRSEPSGSDPEWAAQTPQRVRHLPGDLVQWSGRGRPRRRGGRRAGEF